MSKLKENKEVEKKDARKKFTDDAFFIWGKITKCRIDSTEASSEFRVEIIYKRKDNPDYPELFKPYPEGEDDYVEAFLDEGNGNTRKTNVWFSLDKRYSTIDEEKIARRLVGMSCLLYRQVIRIYAKNEESEIYDDDCEFFQDITEEKIFFPAETLPQKITGSE